MAAPTLDTERLRPVMKDELRDAYRRAIERTKGEQMYGFAIYTAPLAEYTEVTFSTEEGLRRIAAEHAEKEGDSTELWLRSLRWSPCDSPYHGLDDAMIETNRLRNEGPDPYDDTTEAEAAVEVMFDLYTQTLADLDAEGLFGAGAVRRRLTVGVLMGDQSDEERIAFATRLNPPEVVERFKAELASAETADEELGD